MADQLKAATEHTTENTTRRFTRMLSDRSTIKSFEQIIRNSAGCLDIYELFFNYSKPSKIAIPETLLKLPLIDPIYLHSLKGTIEVQSKNCLSDFFSKSINPEGFPQFIHLSDEGVRVCYNVKEALRCWGTCKSSKQMIQKYIVSPDRVPSKIRVYWRAKNHLKSFLITNPSSFPKNHSRNYSYSEKNCSKYLHNLKEFPYAGQIFKASFSNFMPEKSCIQTHQRGFSRKLTIGEYHRNLYTTKYTHENVKIMQIDSNEEISKMIQEFTEIFNNNSDKHDKRVLSEMLIDFIQDEDRRWYMLKCKAFNLDYLPTKVVMNPLLSPHLFRKSVISNEFVKEFYNSIKNKSYQDQMSTKLTPSNLIQRLNKIESKSQNFNLKKPMFIDIKGITASNIDNYLSNTPNFFFPVIRQKNETTDVLNVIAKRYDEYRSKSKSSLK